MRDNKLTENLSAFFENNMLIIDYRGKYNNFHYAFSKITAGLLGMIGIKVLKIDYLTNYVQFHCEIDDLFRTRKLKIKERKKLAFDNIGFFIQLNQILDDKPEYLWMKLSNSPEMIISFQDLQSGQVFFDLKIRELHDLVPFSEINNYILKMLESFHWIQIVDEQNLKFKIILSKDEHETEYKLLNKILVEKLKLIDDKQLLENIKIS